MVEVSYLAALLGGTLALEPVQRPTSAGLFRLRLPVPQEAPREDRRLLLGLATTLVPLGMGIPAVSRLVYGQRSTLVVVSGVVLVLFGLIQIPGGGFGFGPLSRLRGRIRGTSAGATFALGAVYGFAGFCSGPILGAVITVAASSGQVVQGAALLAVYALGMAVPLFLMAAFWDRFDLGRHFLLRGRELRLGRFRLHTTSLISGAMFILLGAVFIAYEGTSALSGLYEAYGTVDLAYVAEEWASSFARIVPDALVLAAALALAVVVYRRRRRKPHIPTGDGFEEFTGEKRPDRANR